MIHPQLLPKPKEPTQSASTVTERNGWTPGKGKTAGKAPGKAAATSPKKPAKQAIKEGKQAAKNAGRGSKYLPVIVLGDDDDDELVESMNRELTRIVYTSYQLTAV